MPPAVEFELAAWRRPIRPQLQTFFGLMLTMPVVAVMSVVPLHFALGVPARLALVASSIVTVVGFAWIVFNDHRRHPAGALRIADGRVTFDAWHARAFDAPLEHVREAIVVRYPTGAPTVLVIKLAVGRIYVHEPRLRASSLADVQRALMDALKTRGTIEGVNAASARRVARVTLLTSLAARLGTVAAIGAVFLTVVRIIAYALRYAFGG